MVIILDIFYTHFLTFLKTESKFLHKIEETDTHNNNCYEYTSQFQRIYTNKICTEIMSNVFSFPLHE